MRAKSSVARKRSKKRLFREVRGQQGGRSKLLRNAKEVVVKSRCYAYRDRRRRKRDFRALWITRITAACRMRGLSYSRFVNGLATAGIELNRKMLSEMAIHEPAVFDEIVAIARESVSAAA